jgi:hypothetical protein
MAEPKVFLVLLRRPKSEPSEQRDDPFYELGSFGCTGCHSGNLFHPRHAEELEGARLAFVQGGRLGFRLVLLTPPITVKPWADRCEAKWTPSEMPFRYAKAPIVACNHGPGQFPLVEEIARKTRRGQVEGGLASLFRSRAHPLSPRLAREVTGGYEEWRDHALASDIAETYLQALPWDPPRPDHQREATYRQMIRKLRSDSNGMQGQSPCSRPRRRQSARHAKRCA